VTEPRQRAGSVTSMLADSDELQPTEPVCIEPPILTGRPLAPLSLTKTDLAALMVDAFAWPPEYEEDEPGAPRR
jgi:hypothetical protein